MMESILPSALVIAAGTYDGVLAGWEFKDGDMDEQGDHSLKLTFATAVHDGSIRSLCIAGSSNNNDMEQPGPLLSCGYDESLKTHDWQKRMTSSGEIRTPSDFGTPECSAFAPPTNHSTHCMIGFSNGKICIYKKRDWSVQHVLAGHEGGVGALAVHPTGKIALSGGVGDGKLKLWDLTKGRLAFVNKIDPASTHGGRTKFDPINSIVWSKDGEFYALSHGTHITVRQVANGKALLDVDMSSRVNQVALMIGSEGLYVAAGCNDGSLPILKIEDSESESRRAIMAIEPVDSHLAKEERFKCILALQDYLVVTANSAGVISLMNLQGAVNMLMSEGEEENDSINDDESVDEQENKPNVDDDEVELAVDIIDSVRLGTGARITCLAAWCKSKNVHIKDDRKTVKFEESPAGVSERNNSLKKQEKRKLRGKSDIEMDAQALKKARSLVEKAKKLKRKKEKRKEKK